VTEIRAEIRDFRQTTTASFNAMREDLSNLRADFTEMRADFTEMRGEVSNQREDLGRLRAEMRGRFDAVAAGHQQIVDLLTTLIDRDAG
jgi:septal ring factor EnvC (AmiA/AmiB activator)